MTSRLQSRARTAFVDLFALRRLDDLGLAAYVAGDLRQARHVLRLPAGSRHRTLLRGEAQPWSAGLAAAAGHEELVDQLAEVAVPALLTLDQAAAQLGLTVRGVGHVIGRGGLYPLYGTNAQGVAQERFVFAAQVKAEQTRRALAGGDLKPARRRVLEDRLDQARQGWLQIRHQLPVPLRESMADVDLRPLPSPDPLPLGRATRAAPAALLIRALQLAETLGWLTYHHPTDEGYLVTVGLQTTLPAGWVLPWLLGVADWHGRADLVAYRPGLG